MTKQTKRKNLLRHLKRERALRFERCEDRMMLTAIINDALTSGEP